MASNVRFRAGNEPGGNAAVKGAVFAVTRLPWRKSESAFA
jgi:hypothetical protein